MVSAHKPLACRAPCDHNPCVLLRVGLCTEREIGPHIIRALLGRPKRENKAVLLMAGWWLVVGGWRLVVGGWWLGGWRVAVSESGGTLHSARLGIANTRNARIANRLVYS
jgi:hypothetical protein